MVAVSAMSNRAATLDFLGTYFSPEFFGETVSLDISK